MKQPTFEVYKGYEDYITRHGLNGLYEVPEAEKYPETFDAMRSFLVQGLALYAAIQEGYPREDYFRATPPQWIGSQEALAQLHRAILSLNTAPQFVAPLLERSYCARYFVGPMPVESSVEAE